MRLLYVHDFFAPGNSRYGHDLSRHLIARGHEVHVLAGAGPLGPLSGATLDGVTFHTYAYPEHRDPVRFVAETWTRGRRAFDRLRRHYRPDVILYNQPLCANVVGTHPAAARVPGVYSFVSPWPEEHRVARGSGPGILARRALEESALRRASSVMVISRFMVRRLLAWHRRVSPAKLHVIYGAIDTTRFRPPVDRASLRLRWGLDPGDFVVFTMRRLVPRMGIGLLLQAAVALRARIPRFRVWIGGDGPLRPEMERAVREYGLGRVVEFLGYVPDADLPDRYAAADLFVLPTRALEGFGLVMLEALACGTPFVATRVAAIPEILDDALPDALIPPEVPALVDAVVREASLRRRARFEGPLRERYSWPRVAGHVEEILDRACACP